MALCWGPNMAKIALCIAAALALAASTAAATEPVQMQRAESVGPSRCPRVPPRGYFTVTSLGTSAHPRQGVIRLNIRGAAAEQMNVQLRFTMPERSDQVRTYALRCVCLPDGQIKCSHRRPEVINH